MAKQVMNGSDATPELTNQLGQLRDILFGEDKQKFEAHFQHIEESTHHQIEQLTKYINQEISSLREDMDKQLKYLSDQISDADHLHNEREDQLQQFADSTAEQLSTFEQATEKAAKDLEQKLNTDNKSLNKLLDKRFSSLTEQLEALGSSLNNNKADRELLASVLTQAAAQIGQIKPVPEKDNS